MCQFQRRRELAGRGRAQPRQALQRFGWAVQQRAQRPVPVQQIARSLYCVLAAQAGADEDRQQLGIGQGSGPARQKFLARAFIGGPVVYVHMARLPVLIADAHQAKRGHRLI